MKKLLSLFLGMVCFLGSVSAQNPTLVYPTNDVKITGGPVGKVLIGTNFVGKGIGTGTMTVALTNSAGINLTGGSIFMNGLTISNLATATSGSNAVNLTQLQASTNSIGTNFVGRVFGNGPMTVGLTNTSGVWLGEVQLNQVPAGGQTNFAVTIPADISIPSTVSMTFSYDGSANPLEGGILSIPSQGGAITIGLVGANYIETPGGVFSLSAGGNVFALGAIESFGMGGVAFKTTGDTFVVDNTGNTTVNGVLAINGGTSVNGTNGLTASISVSTGVGTSTTLVFRAGILINTAP